MIGASAARAGIPARRDRLAIKRVCSPPRFSHTRTTGDGVAELIVLTEDAAEVERFFRSHDLSPTLPERKRKQIVDVPTPWSSRSCVTWSAPSTARTLTTRPDAPGDEVQPAQSSGGALQPFAWAL